MFGPRIARDLFNLRSTRKAEEKTLVISRGTKTYIESNGRSIRPLVEAIALLDRLEGCTIFDRTVGLAAAKLHLELEPGSVYAHVMSREAQEFFEAHGIPFYAHRTVETIIANERTCPLEVLARRHEADELLEILSEFS
ncbi:MAG: DUF1893 domain-containing protein [Candidatus Woesearchaeota archaeon]